MDSTQGFALVAAPHLSDPNFMRTVVYILRHDDEGALGLILNRPTKVCVNELLSQLGEESCCNEEPVFYGGPCDGPLVMLQSVQVDDHILIAVASDQEQILAHCEHGSSDVKFRLFDGYAGWGAEQLESELNAGDWMVWDVQPNDVFSGAEELWGQAVQSIGREVLTRTIDPARIPEDPAYN
ncbi:MAG: YqgE/AlgH family protein [Planctomycetota bacterium]|nr:YqgE/AlgH family protein [Planctomycetota bacterium]